jgi:hypothetical protein
MNSAAPDIGFSGASGANANLWVSLLNALGQKKLE